MTEYLNLCETTIIPNFLHQIALRYIYGAPESGLASLVEFVEGNGEKEIQLMFDKFPKNMRMYGSAKELVENVKIYKNFPGSDQYFNTCGPYFTTPVIYDNLKGDKKYISKPDMFVMLQSMILKTLKNKQPHFVSKVFPLFLASQAKKVNGPVEFVPFEQKVFNKMWKKINDIYPELERDKELFVRLCVQLEHLSSEALFPKFKFYVPNNWDAEEADVVREELIRFDQRFRVYNPFMLYHARANVFDLSRIINETLRGEINKRPELFLPNSGKTPITVRVFEDRGKKFVMKAELFNAMKVDSGSTLIYEDPDNIYDTMRMEDVLEKYGAEFKNIEFIRYPIQRAKHRAVPINGADSKDPFCILAVDALFEYFRSLILDHKMFQIWDNPDDNSFHSAFDKMEAFFFMPNHETPYFLRSKMFDSFNVVPLMKPAKTIRSAKPNGFTVQNLKNELAHLGLTVTFPEIQDHAEVVYAHVDRVKKAKILRTCDLYDAVEYCQLICVFERLPNFKKFLHNQGGCGRVPGLKQIQGMTGSEFDEDEPVAKKSAIQPTIAESFANAIPDETKNGKLHRAVMQLMARAALPLNFVENPAWKNFCAVATPKFNCKGRKHFQRVELESLYEEYKQKICSELESAPYVSLGFDGWTDSSNKHQYLGVIAYFVKDAELSFRVIGVVDIRSESHTGDFIKRKLESVATDFGIGEKICAIVRDGGPDVKAASKLLGLPHFDCLAHKINLAVKEGVDGFKSLNSALGKLRKITNIVNKSSNARREYEEVSSTLDVPPLALKKHIEVRWNTVHAVFERALKVKDTIDFLSTEKEDWPKMTSTDWKAAASVVEILQPIVDATLMIQNHGMTSSAIIPLCKVLIRELREMKKFKEFCSSMTRKLQEELEKYKMIDYLIIGMMLDVRFKDDFAEDEWKQLLLEKLVGNCEEEDDDVMESSETSSTQTKDNPFSRFMRARTPEAPPKPSFGSQKELINAPGLKCSLCDVAEDSQSASVPPKVATLSKSAAKKLKAKNKLERAQAPTDLDSKIACLESEIASQAEKSTKIESDLLKKTGENEQLQVTYDKLQVDVSNYSEQLKVMESSKTQLTEAHSIMASLESKLVSQVDKSKKLELEILIKSQENAKLSMENSGLMDDISEKNQEVEAVTRDLEYKSVYLNEAIFKASYLEDDLKTEQEKSKKSEEMNASPSSEIDLKQLTIKKTQENEELHVANVRLQLENEMNKQFIEELLDKVAKLSVVRSNN